MPATMAAPTVLLSLVISMLLTAGSALGPIVHNREETGKDNETGSLNTHLFDGSLVHSPDPPFLDEPLFSFGRQTGAHPRQAKHGTAYIANLTILLQGGATMSSDIGNPNHEGHAFDPGGLFREHVFKTSDSSKILIQYYSFCGMLSSEENASEHLDARASYPPAASMQQRQWPARFAFRPPPSGPTPCTVIHSTFSNPTSPFKVPQARLFKGFISDKELYEISIVRHRAIVHLQLYGQNAFSLVRQDLEGPAQSHFALRFSFAICCLWWCTPALYLLCLSIFQPKSAARGILPRALSNTVTAFRSRKHRRRRQVQSLQQNFVKSAAFTYLLLFYLHTAPSSGRKHWTPERSMSPSKMGRQRRGCKLPHPIVQLARWCDKVESHLLTGWSEICSLFEHNNLNVICYTTAHNPYMIALYACFPLCNDTHCFYLFGVIKTASFGLLFANVLLPVALVFFTFTGLKRCTHACIITVYLSIKRRVELALSLLVLLLTSISTKSQQLLRCLAAPIISITVICGTICCYCLWNTLLLLRCRDVERNPGPNPGNTFVGRLNDDILSFDILPIATDGNCLFRSILKSANLSDNQHLSLRNRCVQTIVSNWNSDVSVQANTIHADSPAFNVLQPFPTAAAYAEYMCKAGHWGSDLEALVCAQVLNLRIRIWSLHTGLSGEVLNGICTNSTSPIDPYSSYR